MTKTTKDILIEARKLIEKEENWRQEEYGLGTGKLCASGALIEVGDDVGTEAYAALSTAMGGMQVCEFNDTHTHSEVLSAFTKAIEAQS